MTPILTIINTTDRDQFRRDCGTVGATLLLLAALSAIGYVLRTEPAPDYEIERIMRAACRLPDINGAVTIFTMRDNKLECGRYQ
jgi:hypothetical protein